MSMDTSRRCLVLLNRPAVAPAQLALKTREKEIMKSPRSSLASRYSVAFILCLSCLMILIASSVSVSPNSSLSSSSMAYDATAVAAARERLEPTLASPPLLPPGAPNITATKSHTPSGNAHPGDTLTYMIVISNTTGNADAMGVNFSDTIDPNTTLVGGSVNSPPIANNNNYTAPRTNSIRHGAS